MYEKSIQPPPPFRDTEEQKVKGMKFLLNCPSQMHCLIPLQIYQWLKYTTNALRNDTVY